jgi:DNA-binding Lrp family transcriptional regulator
MKKKIIFITVIIFIVFVLLPICSEAVNKQNKKTELNDDLFVEIKSQVNFAVDQAFKKYKGTKAVERATEAMEKIYKKYGVTKEELDEYITRVSKEDVSRAGQLLMEVAQRTQELMSSTKKETKPVSGKNEVKGFPDIPVYAGAESIAGAEMGDTKWAEEMLTKEGYIWYEFGNKLSAEYDKDPRGVDDKIVEFYKEELAKKGWKYIGKGVDTHHWAKGENALGIYFPADCTIEYRHMSAEEAKGNCGQLSEEKWIEAFLLCAKDAQEICEKQNIKSMDEYQMIMVDEEAFESFNKKIEQSINKALKPYGVTLKRFAEIKKEYNLDEMMGRLYAEHEKEINTLQLGFIILTGLME